MAATTSGPGNVSADLPLFVTVRFSAAQFGVSRLGGHGEEAEKLVLKLMKLDTATLMGCPKIVMPPLPGGLTEGLTVEAVDCPPLEDDREVLPHATAPTTRTKTPHTHQAFRMPVGLVTTRFDHGRLFIDHRPWPDCLVNN
jgi:hypothetical protein